MIGVRVLVALCAMWWVAPAVACAAVFQFEVLGLSDDWIVMRENLPASATDTAACRYPGLDPSEYVGVKVHFVRLSAEAKRSRLVPLAPPDSSMTVYPRERSADGCTPATLAEQRWREIAAHAKSLGLSLSPKPPAALVLGAAVPARPCVLIGGAAAGGPPCRRTFRHVLRGTSIQIGVFLAAVPETPDERVCQLVGHRFGAVVQIAGLNFGTVGTVAPGGFVDHYDCRGQQFQPLRLYDLEGMAVLLGGFRGTSIADRDEQPFVMIFPTRPAS